MLDYLWIVIGGGIASFVASMGIGANDVGNAFASSVGSRALTVKQAVAIASVFEFSGAILLGSHVTETIRKGIADYECFEDKPEIFMYGCFWVMVSVGLWLFLASYYEMPVSTTHSCVGGMVGMTLVTGGSDCVIWYKATDTFPWIGGVSGIVLSWVISPVFSAIASGSIFYATRSLVLRNKNSFERSYKTFPIFVGVTLMLNSFFIIYKGGKGIGLDDISVSLALLISCGAGAFFGLSIVPFIPMMKRRTLRIHNQHNQAIDETSGIHMEEGPVKLIHSNAEKFDKKTEESFKYLQIFTAVCDSFSHGANDVANAIGPYAAIVTIWMNNGNMSEDVDMRDHSYWILGMGGAGITIGLLLYGYKIIHAIGVKLCCITPSRGFAIELGSAIIVIIGSRLGIPLSTTHCQIGSTMGVASLEDFRHCSGINWAIVSKTFIGWILTLVVVGGTSALFVSQGVYAPTMNSSPIC
jgi:sodium-dependent phosphate transporter